MGCTNTRLPVPSNFAENISLPLYELISLVSKAADKGKEESKDMIATMGRAKTLGERSLGHPDAGACSVAIILKSMSEFINQ